MTTTPTPPPRLFNVGSLNIDYVYRLSSIVRPGETLAASSRDELAGGKGANQSAAAALAGAAVSHVGCVGPDGAWLSDELARRGVDVSHLRTLGGATTGHAVIQLDADGENAIFLFPGANHAIDQSHLDAALSEAQPGDWVLTQNETNATASAVRAAAARGLRVAFNPAPITPDLEGFPLEEIGLLIVNQTEGEALSGEAEPGACVEALGRRVAGAAVLTLGSEGAVAHDGTANWVQPAFAAGAVADTTGAGDTFIGTLLAALLADGDLSAALRRAAAAAALSVIRVGAIAGIPDADEVDRFLADQDS
ncbi:MAG: PfkB family carbohydrate kinase [Planctomycetota bacterium]